MKQQHCKLTVCVLAVVLMLSSTLAGVSAQGSQPGPNVIVQDVYNQLGGGTGAISSQSFVSGTNTNRKAAVDFQTDTRWWLIGFVAVAGTLQIGTGSSLQGVTVEFYNDSGGLPGSSASGPLVMSSGLINGTSVLTLPQVVAMPPSKTFWMSVQANFSTFSPGSLWSWGTRSAVINNLGAYINTSTVGCEVWNVPWDQCGVSTVPDERELQFALNYTPFVPTSSVYLPLVRK